MAAKKVVMFLGSVRDGRHGLKVANYYRQVLGNYGLDVTLIDPLHIDFPVLRQPLHFMKNQADAPEWLQNLNKSIISADGFVIVSPEYNCSLPPALTNMMDHFPPASYRHRPVSLVFYSVGPFGGIRAAAVCRSFVGELGMVVLPSEARIPTVATYFPNDDPPAEERIVKKADQVARELQWYMSALSNQRGVEAPTT